MTETPDQRVRRLQAELAAAQADQRVAHLQAELAEAHGGDPAPPGYPQPDLTAAPMGYPQADVTAAGSRFLPAGPPATPVFAGHGPSDYADPTSTPPTSGPGAAKAHRRDHAGFDATDPDIDGYSGDYRSGEAYRSVTADDRLTDPPRHVPLAFLAAAFSWRWWEAWAFFMVAVTPIALWMFVPWAATVAGILTLAAAAFLRLRTDWANYVLLRHGKVAQQVRVRRDSTGTYYSGVTYQNVRMAVAHGWQVKREWYSGPGTKSVLDYTVDGRPGTMTLHGLPYAGGIVLADPRRPGRAKCVSQFPYDLDRDPSGNWIGTVSTRVWVGSFFTLAMWGGWALLILYWQLAVVR